MVLDSLVTLNGTRKQERQAGWGLPGWRNGGTRSPDTRAGGSECAGLEQPAGEMGFDSALPHRGHVPSISLPSRDLPWRNGAAVEKEAQTRAFPTVLLEMEGTGLQPRGPSRALAPLTGWPSHCAGKLCSDEKA